MSEDAPQPELVVHVDGEADLPVLVVRAQAWLREGGVVADERARIVTAASELASNIVKYAGRGRLRLARVRQGNHEGVELRAEDSGPGIATPDLALTDRYSTSGSLGLGLPGVRRLMDDFDLRTAPGTGTSVRVRRWLT